MTDISEYTIKIQQSLNIVKDAARRTNPDRQDIEVMLAELAMICSYATDAANVVAATKGSDE